MVDWKEGNDRLRKAGRRKLGIPSQLALNRPQRSNHPPPFRVEVASLECENGRGGGEKEGCRLLWRGSRRGRSAQARAGWQGAADSLPRRPSCARPFCWSHSC